MKKIGYEPKKFEYNFEDSACRVRFFGEMYRIQSDLIKINSHIKGEMVLVCDLSGENFTKQIDENTTFLLKDGIWNSTHHINNDEFDVIECFGGYIDIDSLLISELESIKLEYHTKE